MMHIDTIRIYCDLVELQNFSRTAEKHGVSQSAISQQLAQLELQHKCQLIDRKTRPLSTTTAGEIFYHACQDILERYDQLNSQLKSLSRKTNRINFAAIFSIGMYTLQPYVKKFIAKYPHVNLNIEYKSASEIYDRILRGDVDFGAVALPQKDRAIEVYPFENEPLVLACCPLHNFANEPVIDIHKLHGQEFIAFETGLATRTHIDNILKRYNVSVRIVSEFDNTETIKRAVEIDAGVSILPETTIAAELAYKKLKAIPFSNEKFYRPTGIIVRKSKPITPAGQYLIDLLHKKHNRNGW